MRKRENRNWSAYIDSVIVLLPYVGERGAICMLLGAGVSRAVIERVIAKPDGRRSTI